LPGAQDFGGQLYASDALETQPLLGALNHATA
jgi:hypothetical protein